MKKRTREILKELETKVGQAGKAAFQRLGLALELLADQDWVAEKGSLSNAHRFIQKEYFGDLCLAVRIETLLEIRREFTNEHDWESRKWDLQVLRAEIVTRRQKDNPERTRKTATIKELETLQNEKNKLEIQHQQLSQTLDQEKHCRVEETDHLKARIKELENENNKLKCENERLKGRLEELEKIRAVA